MKIWRIETTITSEDEYDEQKIFAQIDRDLNRGDGIYMRVPQRDLRAKIALKFVRKVKDE